MKVYGLINKPSIKQFPRTTKESPIENAVKLSRLQNFPTMIVVRNRVPLTIAWSTIVNNPLLLTESDYDVDEDDSFANIESRDSI